MPGPPTASRLPAPKTHVLPQKGNPLQFSELFAGSPKCLQPSAQSPVPSRYSDLIRGEKEPRDAEKTEHPLFRSQGSLYIVNAYDKIKPLLTSKMNN